MLSMYRGESQAWRLTVTLGGVAQDLTGATLYAGLKAQVDDDQALLALDSTDSTEIEILTQSGATLGQALVKLQPEDMESLEPGTYLLDVWLVDATGSRTVLLPPTALGVRRSVTELP